MCRSAIYLLLPLLFSGVFTFRIATQKIYQTIDSEFYCVRRMNATHSIGCQTNADGNVGVLFVIENDEDYEWVLAKGNTVPYIPVMYISQFTTKKLLQLKNSGRISGAIILQPKNATLPKNRYSPDKSCPNNDFGFYVQKLSDKSYCSRDEPWNPVNDATDMMFIDWNMPLYLMTDEASIQNLTSCFERFNKPSNGVDRDWPLCAVQMTARMHAAGDTPTCMRRNNLPYIPMSYPVLHCDPISSYNVFSSLKPMTKNFQVKNRSIILVATRLDSFSLFLNKAQGVSSVVTSIIALLSIVHTFGNNKDVKDHLSTSEKNVLFAFFDGESWDYIGSSRAAYDMKRNKFKPMKTFSPYYEHAKLNLNHISHFIELNQVAPDKHANELWIHTDINITDAEATQRVEQIVTALEQKSSNVTVKRVSPNLSLPPSSLQSFLREDVSIAGVVVTNFEKQYSNNYYNSFLDIADNIDRNETIRYLTGVSSTLSKAIASLIGMKATDITTDEDIVRTLYDCFLVDTNCSLFNEMGYYTNGKLMDTCTSVAAYTREHQMHLVSPLVSTVYRLVAWFTGHKIGNNSKSQCLSEIAKSNKSFAYEWFPINRSSKSNGNCFQTSCFLTEALSPAFIDGESNWVSREYSTWTESIWRMSGARIFLKPSFAQELFTLITGIVIFMLSFVIVYFSKRCVPRMIASNSGEISENDIVIQNHVTRGMEQYAVRGDEITYSDSNSHRKDVITTQL